MNNSAAEASISENYLIIATPIICSAGGFFAYVNYVINQLIYAERNNMHPVVFFGHWSGNGENPYFSAERGDNMWDYYFEPGRSNGTDTYPAFMKKEMDGTSRRSEADLTTLSSGSNAAQLHGYDPESA